MREEKMNRFTRLAVLCAATVTLGLSAEPASAQTSSKIVIYSAYQRELMQPLVDSFNKIHPTISVDLFQRPGEELLATLELEMRARSPRADVIGLNEASMKYLHGRYEALEAYAPVDIDKVRPELRDPRNIIIPAAVNPYLIHYNTVRIQKADLPRTWTDLLNPRWKSMIAVADPKRSQSIQSLVWYVTEYLPKQNQTAYGWEFFKKLGANLPQLESSHSTIRDLTVNGERPIGIQLLSLAQSTMKRGEPTSIVWPSDGVPGELSAFAMVKESKNKDAVKRWLDFIVSKATQQMIPESLGGAPIRNDVDYKYPDGTNLSDVKIVNVDAEFVSANRRVQADKFHEAIAR